MNASREIRSAFLTGVTLTVSFASVVLAIAEGAFFPVGLTPFFAVIAARFNERRHRLILPTIGANILGLLAVAAAGLELAFGTVEARILSGAHLIVYITWIVLFMRKQSRQYWWLLALSVLQLAVASVLTDSPSLGVALAVMLVLMIWTMSLFTLHRLNVRNALPETYSPGRSDKSGVHRVTIRHGIQFDVGRKWIGARFRLMILGMSVASLVISGVVFAAFPRVFVGSPFVNGNTSNSGSVIMARTGFREQVKLGEFGSILQSDERVLRISLYEQPSGAPVSLDSFTDQMDMDELLLRGSAMGWYAESEWTRGLTENGYQSEVRRRRFSNATAAENAFRVKIVQEPPIGTFAFAPTPIVAARLLDARGRLVQRTLTESLIFDVIPDGSWRNERRRRPNTDPITFEVFCQRPEEYYRRNPPVDLPDALQKWLYPNAEPARWLRAEEQYAQQLAITGDLKQMLPTLWNEANQLCADGGRRTSTQECVRRVVQRLRDSGEFKYSLDVSPVDTSLDPVEDFLLNHKTGHCQYFASACALMLQSVGIPARVVNGFKGADLNVITGDIEVKQKHAHVWVEYRHGRRWHTADPTPFARSQFLDSALGDGVLGNIQDAVNDIWDAGLSTVTPETQRAAVLPVLAAFRDAVTRIRQLGLLGAVKLYFQEMMQNPGRWFNWKVLLGTFIVLIPVVLVLRNRPWRWLMHLVHWLSDRFNSKKRKVTHIIRFYETFRVACARAGLIFPASQTALENAVTASHHFQELLPPDVAAIPKQIAWAFNAVRYGDHLLTTEQTDQLGRDVALLTAAISSGRIKNT